MNMIPLKELHAKIQDIMKEFRCDTKAVACTVLDKDGFILYSERQGDIDDTTFQKRVVQLFTTLETLKIINFYEKTEIIMFGENEHGLYTNGFNIVIRSITNNMILLIIFETEVDIQEILPTFEATVSELKNFMMEN